MDKDKKTNMQYTVNHAFQISHAFQFLQNIN